MHAPSGDCAIGTQKYWISTPTWSIPGSSSSVTATLAAYGTSTNLGYFYAPGGELQDSGCGW